MFEFLLFKGFILELKYRREMGIFHVLTDEWLFQSYITKISKSKIYSYEMYAL
jgi:hypothetical protein